MSVITRTYTFVDGTTAYGSQIESEIANIVNAWNNHDAGLSQWTTLSVSGNATIGGTLSVTGSFSFGSGDFTNTGAGKGFVATTPNGLHTYRIAVDNDGSITTEAVT